MGMPYQGGLPWKFASEDGLGVSEVIRRLITGDVLDAGRIPWLSFLALVGTALTIRRALGNPDPPRRRIALGDKIAPGWLLAFGTVCLLMWLGPATWGPGYRRLPLHAELEVMRYNQRRAARRDGTGGPGGASRRSGNRRRLEQAALTRLCARPGSAPPWSSARCSAP